MKHFFAGSALLGAALLFTPMARAQFGPQDQYGPSAVTVLVDRVHEDLDHAYRTAQFSHSDRDRLNGAEKQLRDFTSKWDKGKFDKDELDDAISSLQHVLDNNRLPDRERTALSDDVNQLRRMREAWDRHEIR